MQVTRHCLACSSPLDRVYGLCETLARGSELLQVLWYIAARHRAWPHAGDVLPMGAACMRKFRLRASDARCRHVRQPVPRQVIPAVPCFDDHQYLVKMTLLT